MAEKGFTPIYIILVLVMITVLGVAAYFLTSNNKDLQPGSIDSPQSSTDKGEETSKQVDKFIVSNPVDLTQIKKISKFRSCSGHDFSGKNADEVREENRSMKHYFKPADSLASSIGELKVFAPFDGQIKSVRDEREPRGKETILESETTTFDVTIFHLDLLPSLKERSEITAGQLIGHAHIASQGNDFDIAVTKFIGGIPQIPKEASGNMKKMQAIFFSMIMMDSVFNHMTPEVLSDFEKVGITTQNIIITKEERDQTPCKFERVENAQDWVELQN